MEEKWFFYLTLFLTLFATSLSAGLIPHNRSLNGSGIKVAQPALVIMTGLIDQASTSGGR